MIRLILLLLVAIFGIGLCLLAIYWLSFGLGIFVVAPFALGLMADLITRPTARRHSVLAAVVTVLLGTALMLVTGLEGMICLAMAVPLAFPLAMLGSLTGFTLRRRYISSNERRAILAAAILLGPAGVGAEAVWKPVDPLFPVQSSIEIDAPPARVWEFVISSAIPEEREWLFHTGLAYPKRSTIDGSGPGATRRCEFSTGTFVEPITVWDAPRLLEFSVTSSAPPMAEWSPYAHIHPPHLDGYLVSRRGQFRLTPLAGNRTRLVGTTWYQHHLQPAEYWRWWSDYAIRRIHTRVLRNIKSLAEGPQAPARADR